MERRTEVERVVDHALAVAKESIKAVTRETLHTTGSFLNATSAQLLQCLPGGSSALQLQLSRHFGVNAAGAAFQAPQLPAWMHESASPLNTVVLEAAQQSHAYSSGASADPRQSDNNSGSEIHSRTSSLGPAPHSQVLSDDNEGASVLSSPHGGDFSSLRSSPSFSFRSMSSSRTLNSFARPRPWPWLLQMLCTLFSLVFAPLLHLWRLPVSAPHWNPDSQANRRGLEARNGATRFVPSSAQGAVDSEGCAVEGQSTQEGRRGILRRIDSRTSLAQQLLRTDLRRTITDAMDYFHVTQHLNDFQRRGILEELQVFLELLIERFFNGLQSVMVFCCSPRGVPTGTGARRGGMAAGTGGGSLRRDSSQRAAAARGGSSLGDSVAADGLLDARTCQDIVKEAGYPFERLRVVTEDGYVIFMERIPRKDSCKALFLQHGVFDSSLGWVSNGVVGSQAFAAHDQGYDVFLGNMRGYASGGHVDGAIDKKSYWAYSVNELGMCDIKAMISTIHETKTRELQSLSTSPQALGLEACVPDECSAVQGHKTGTSRGDGNGSSSSFQQEGVTSPESGSAEGGVEIQAVAHSLGGAALMTYIVTQRMKRKPHLLSHAILLSPAGFHQKTPMLFDILAYLLPLFDLVVPRWMPGFYIPTRGLRLLFNKLAQDFHNFPAVGALIQVLFSNFVVGGDPSDWVGALRVPHYTMLDMPGVAYRVMKHLAQMKLSKRFQLYDFGSAAANIVAYGSATPPDLGANYGLIDIPIDVVSGQQDKLIPPDMVRRHYECLRLGGCECTLQQFECAHLDFTLAHKQELLSYVSARLRLHAHSTGGMKYSASCPRLPALGVRRSRRKSNEALPA